MRAQGGQPGGVHVGKGPARRVEARQRRRDGLADEEVDGVVEESAREGPVRLRASQAGGGGRNGVREVRQPTGVGAVEQGDPAAAAIPDRGDHGLPGRDGPGEAPEIRQRDDVASDRDAARKEFKGILGPRAQGKQRRELRIAQGKRRDLPLLRPRVRRRLGPAQGEESRP